MHQMRLILVLLALTVLFSACGTVNFSPSGDVAREDVTLIVINESVSLGDEEILYKMLNHTEQTAPIFPIPQLERKNGESWVLIMLEGVGFCGMPDLVEAEYFGSVPLAWYGNQLTPGEYRLSFAKYPLPEDQPDYSISAEFIISGNGEQ